MNKIYAEVLFKHSFLSINLDISYKLANYSLSYATRQLYLGAEDIVDPVLHPVKTVKNLFSLGKNMILHPIETPAHIAASVCVSTWHQPTRALTRLAGDILLSKGSSVVGTKLLTVKQVEILRRIPTPRTRF